MTHPSLDMSRNAVTMMQVSHILCFVFFTILATSSCRGSNDVSIGGTYNLIQTVLMQDASQDPVGYQIAGTISVRTIHAALHLVNFVEPKLYVMSRKAPTPHGFVSHDSTLDTAHNSPFLIEMKDGKIVAIYVDPLEHVAMVNLKSGIASIFQFQADDSILEETDSSGTCSVAYKKLNPITISKIKSNCKTLNKSALKDTLWGGKLKSNLETIIKFRAEDNQLEEIVAQESHSLQPSINENVITKVSTTMKVTREESIHENDLIYKDGVDQVVNQIQKKLGLNLQKHGLQLTQEPVDCKINSCPSLSAIVKENKKHLQGSEIGTSKSAFAFLRLVQAVCDSSVEEIYKVINSKDNKDILEQLMDVLGAAQTKNAHQAALKILKINTNYVLDTCERYFWALSVSSQPNEEIIKDLVKIVKTEHPSQRLWQTLVLTMSAMTNHLSQLPDNQNHELIKEVRVLLEEKLNNCTKEDENCRQLYLKAFANLGIPESLPTLLIYAVNSTRKSGVASMYAIKKLGRDHWDKNVLKIAEQIILANHTSDSSARTFSIDILLETRPTGILLARILSILKNKEPSMEVKEYLLQRLNQISESDEQFRLLVRKTLYLEGLYQYDSMAQGGLSTAFNRDFMDGGSLSTTQEVLNGFLKKGHVHVNLQHNNSEQSIFTLGLFSTGLNSFMSDSGEGEDEEVSAGLELTVLGVDLRPFIFFIGQGELMGHVWSGTASTKTPAFQALLLLGNEHTQIPLGSGVIADIDLLAGASVDLSGQIEISIWNRNAVSLVQNSAGVALDGTIKVNSMFVKTQVELNMLTEPSLELSSNIEFSGKVALCLQLRQPSSSVRYNTYKVERIPGSKHKLRKTRYKTILVPGKTYSLNSKNSEMCSVIFKDL